MRKTILAITAAATMAAPILAIPSFADAQTRYGRGDICRQERREAGQRGAVAGAIVGGIIGNQVAGRGARTEGTVIGAVGGAVAGNQIARANVRCTSYPRHYRARNNCRWVVDDRGRDFEVCQRRDGYWYRSGRG